MDRSDLRQLSKDQLIELVLRLQRPDKNSRTSSKPRLTKVFDAATQESWSQYVMFHDMFSSAN